MNWKGRSEKLDLKRLTYVSQGKSQKEFLKIIAFFPLYF